MCLSTEGHLRVRCFCFFVLLVIDFFFFCIIMIMYKILRRSTTFFQTIRIYILIAFKVSRCTTLKIFHRRLDVLLPLASFIQGEFLFSFSNLCDYTASDCSYNRIRGIDRGRIDKNRKCALKGYHKLYVNKIKVINRQIA